MPAMHDPVRCALIIGVLLALGGCSLAPQYVKPSAGTLPEAFKGAKSPEGWTVATPGDQAARKPWWTVYGDAKLDQLENELNEGNPDLSLALARLDISRAFLAQLGAQGQPHAAIDAGSTNDRQSDRRPLRGANQPNEYDTRTLGMSADYEIDLWGRIRNEVAAGGAQTQAAKADLASARLVLQADLADLYVRLRGYDVQLQIVNDSLQAFGEGRKITQNRMEGGVSSGLDVARASAQLSDAQAQATELRVQRALTEHAIAALVGQSASTFSLAPERTALSIPSIPLGVPSSLLERRPDIAAAERRVFSANAGIGVARAALYPDISLSAALGFQDVGHGNLLSAANQFWSLGPSAALALFDGGLRRGREAQAKAEFAAASAQYRRVVLKAFQEVEDNLTLLQELGRESEEERAAADAAKQSQALATNRYNEGVVSYLEVVTAQTTALNAERTAELVHTRQLQASVDLIRALGGGWDGDLNVSSAP